MDSQAITVTLPDTLALEDAGSAIERRALALIVKDEPSHREALEVVKAARINIRIVKSEMDPICKSADQTHKRVTALRATLCAPSERAERFASGLAYDYEQEARREADRLAREATERARKAEEERHLQDAIAAEAEGNQAEAEAIMAEPIIAPVIHVEPALAEVEGMSARTLYSAECYDLWLLIAHVATHPDFRGLLSADGPALNALARAQREAFAVPGCRLVVTQSRAVKA